jgi:hypothetical protein
MAAKYFQVRILAPALLCQMLLFAECGNSQQQRGLDFNPAQNEIRKEIGLLKSSYTPEDTERLRKEIDKLISRGSTSALFDKALLYWRDSDLLGMFKGFKAYYDATGDDSRIFLYANHGFYVDPPGSEFMDGMRYYDQLAARPEAFAPYELAEFDPRVTRFDTLVFERYHLTSDGPSSWKSYESLDAFGYAIQKRERPDPQSVSKFQERLDDKQLVDDLIWSLLSELRFQEAYAVFESHSNLFDVTSIEDRVTVTLVLYYSGHYAEFVSWHPYHGPSYGQRDEMLVASFLKLGKVDDSLRFFSDLIANSTLTLEGLRDSFGERNNYAPAFSNLLFFYYFRGVYDDFKRAGKTEEIDRLFERRYATFSKAEVRSMMSYRQALRSPNGLP